MNRAEIFAQVFSNRWPSPEDLVKYAQEKRGYGGDDGYYGVTYPSDLDEYQKQVEGEFIPEGYVEVSYWDGDFQSIQIKEAEYLSALRAHLVSIKRDDLLKDWNNA